MQVVPPSTAGDSCPQEGCEGRLVDAELTPVSVGPRSHTGPVSGEEKIRAMHTELAQTFSKLSRIRSE
jgi:hypothetical protein